MKETFALGRLTNTTCALIANLRGPAPHPYDSHALHTMISGSKRSSRLYSTRSSLRVKSMSQINWSTRTCTSKCYVSLHIMVPSYNYAGMPTLKADMYPYNSAPVPRGWWVKAGKVRHWCNKLRECWEPRWPHLVDDGQLVVFFVD